MTGCYSDARIDAWRYSYGSYWIVLFSSLWRELLPLRIDTVTKGMERELAEAERITGPATNNFYALSQGNSGFQNLSVSLRLH